MESFDNLAFKDRSLSCLSNVETSYRSSFDVLFEKVANSTLPNTNNTTLNHLSLRGVSVSPSLAPCQSQDNFEDHFDNILLSDDVMQKCFEREIHDLTIAAPSLLNASILSHFTARPSLVQDPVSIHHSIQMLKYKRLNSTLNTTLNTTSIRYQRGTGNSTAEETEKGAKGLDFLNSNSPIVIEDSDDGEITFRILNDPMPDETGCRQIDSTIITTPGDTHVAGQYKGEKKSGHNGLKLKSKATSPRDDRRKTPIHKKSKRSTRLTPKMANLLQESEVRKQKKASKPVIELTDWIIRPLPDSRGVCVEGQKKGLIDFWHSTAITEAKSEKLVMTASGSEYLLKGKLNSLCTLSAGFTTDVAESFKDGFPEDWRDIIEDFFSCAEKSIPMCAEISPVKKFKQKKKVVAKKVESPENLLEGHKKANSSKTVTLIEEGKDLDSVLTPVGLVKKSQAASNMTVTRCGRVSLPPLARWSGQKYVFKNSEIMVDFETSDARRAIMKETRDIYKLSKSSLKMIELKDIDNKIMSGDRAASKNFKGSDSKAIRQAKLVKSKNIKDSNLDSSSKMHSRNNSCDKHSNKRDSVTFGQCTKVKSKSADRESPELRRKSTRIATNDHTLTDKRTIRQYTDSNKLEMKQCQVVLKKLSRRKSDKRPTTVITKRKSVNWRSSETGKGKSRRNVSEEHSLSENDESPITEITNRECVQHKSGEQKKSKRQQKKQSKENFCRNKTKIKKSKNSVAHEDSEGMSDPSHDGKKRKRSPSHTPITDTSVESNTKGSLDTTPRSTSGKKSWKKRRLSPEEDSQDSWSSLEKDSLQKALRSVESDSPDFWRNVASIVETKTSDECQLYHTKYLDQKTSKRLNKIKGKSKSLSGMQKSGPVKAGKGTMKRKKEIRAFLEAQNEGYMDNLFDGTPFATRKPASSLINQIDFDKEDDEIFGANCNFFTPMPGQGKITSPQSCLQLPFASTKKTPACLSNFSDTPESTKRQVADKYIHTFVQNKKKSLTNYKNNSASTSALDLESSLLPKKSLFSPAGKASVFLAEDDTNDDLHEDEEEDNRFMYYWNDFD